MGVTCARRPYEFRAIQLQGAILLQGDAEVGKGLHVAASILGRDEAGNLSLS